jgi:hypothetical protein
MKGDFKTSAVHERRLLDFQSRALKGLPGAFAFGQDLQPSGPYSGKIFFKVRQEDRL